MKNIVLITVDCLRYDRATLGENDNKTMPALNNLSDKSYVFERAYATGPYTTESIPGIIAGRHSYNGVYFGDDSAWKAINPESTTVASHLSAHGYNTSATLTNPHLTKARNFDKGFDQFGNLRTKGEDRAEQEQAEGDTRSLDLLQLTQRKFNQSSKKYTPYLLMYIGHRYQQYRTDWPTIAGKEVRQAFCSRVQNQDSPFFSWTHFMDSHAPIHPGVTKSQNRISPDLGTIQHLYHIGNQSRSYPDPVYNRIYDAALRYIDDQINEIIQTLQAIGEWDNTILIVTGDHGEVLGDRLGIYSHPRHHHYDESLHVPLLVRVPGTDGQQVSQPVSLAWLPKMITELLDLTTGGFPYDYGDPLIFSDHQNGTDRPPVISDSLDAHGHTVTVRDNKKKIISHYPDNNTLDVSYPYFKYNTEFDYQRDQSETDPSEAVDGDLLEVADKIATDADTIPNIRGGFSASVERRLEDLGYKMD